jgi:hypothetical protein
MRLSALLTVLTVGLTTGHAEAANYNLIGSGNRSCGTWTAEERDQRYPIFGQWVLGFLSGIGYEGAPSSNPLQGMDAYGVFGWIDNYCREHPIDDIADAASAFSRMHPR